MKKIISILLIIVMLVSLVSITAFARDKDISEFMYYDKIVDTFGEYYETQIRPVYDELCYHYSPDNPYEPDWMLAFCGYNPAPIEEKYGIKVGNRVLSVVGGSCSGFADGYGVYVTRLDKFIELRQSSLKQIEELCPDFVKTIEENEVGQQIGDVDDSGHLSVIDATYIQRYIVDYYDPIQNYFAVNLDGGKDKVLVSDIDNDGITTVMDATYVQRNVAGDYSKPALNEEIVFAKYEQYYPPYYPFAPDESVNIDFNYEISRHEYGFSCKNYGYPDFFLTIIKNTEQYKDVLGDFSFYGDDEEFFDTHWIVASIVKASNEREYSDIDELSVLGDTLYVGVGVYRTSGDGFVTPLMPPYISLVSVEKEKLGYVKNIERVESDLW